MNNSLTVSDYMFIAWIFYLISGAYLVEYVFSYISPTHSFMIWIISGNLLYICAWCVHLYISGYRNQKEHSDVNQTGS